MSGDSHPCRFPRIGISPVASFLRYAVIALVATAGPTWLGQVGVAAAGFRPTGIEQDYALAGAGNVTELGSPAPQDPSPGPEPTRKPVPEIQLLPPQHGGMSSTGSAPGSANSGIVGVVTSISWPPAPFITRLKLARERVTVISPPRSVFEPPRIA